MKKVLLLSFATIAFTVAAGASTLSTVCGPAPATLVGQSNSVTVNCNGFAVASGATINSITLRYIFANLIDGFATGSSTTAYSFDAPGTGLDASGTTTRLTSPDGGTATITSGFAPFLAAFQVFESYTGASNKVTGATFNLSLTLDYTVVPEPGSYTLIGLGLLALAVVRTKS